MSDPIPKLYDATTPVAQYTFVPWSSAGMTNVLSAISGGRGKVTTTFKVLSNNPEVEETTISKDIFLLGPGDIIGINKKAIINVIPQAGSKKFKWNYFPFIEFYEEDLPWRFTPQVRPDGFVAGERVTPWLALIALKEGEFDAAFRTRPLPTLTVNKANLPDPSDLWASAHVQFNHPVVADKKAAFHKEVETLLENQPDLGISRILCLRQLEKDTSYTAFLVPTFKSGALAGLGDLPANIQAAGDQGAWEGPDESVTLPIYHHWSFRTSEGNDFEQLARDINVAPEGSVSLSRLNIEALNHEMHPAPETLAQISKVLTMESALMPVNQPASSWPKTEDGDGAIRNELEKRIERAILPEEKSSPGDFESDPEIGAPPFYSRWHAAKDKVADLPWLQDLNLHPGRRALGGLAAEVVRRWQDELMDEAWEQLGAIQEANRKVVRAQMAKAVNEIWIEKHIKHLGEENAPSSAEQIIDLTSNLHSRLRIQEDGAVKTIQHKIENSPLTSVSVNTGLNKILRPNGRLSRQIRKQFNLKVQDNLISGLNNNTLTITSKQPTIYPPNSDGGTPKIDRIEYIRKNNLEQYTPYEMSTASTLQGNLNDIVTVPPNPIGNMGQLSDAILSTLSPGRTIAARSLQGLNFLSDASARLKLPEKDNFKPAMAAPELGRPAYFYLAQLAPDLILPGYRDMADNTIQVLTTYRPFVEAFLAGLNHEMARELLWREFPTDQRGTYFSQFWDNSDHIALGDQTSENPDILPMHLWKNSLGSHANGQSGEFTAFAIRAELTRQFPDLFILAQRAKRPEAEKPREPDFDFTEDSLKEKVQFPLFRIKMGDVLIVGFRFSPDEAIGDDDIENTNPEDQGWYLVFSERPGEPQFGLDATQKGQVLKNWSDVSWQTSDIRKDNGYLNIGSSNIEPENSDDIQWNKDAAHFAWILMQQPTRVFYHASTLLS